MADQSELALSDVLCFVVNKFAKLPTKQMKGILVDSYSDEAVSEAKIRLLNDIEALEYYYRPNFLMCHGVVMVITRSPAIAEGPRDAGVPVEIW